MRAIQEIMSNIPAKDIHSVSIFDLSIEELRERLRPTFEAIKREKFAKGGYLTYYDASVCPTNKHMVHEYCDRKELVRVDYNGKEHLIKTL
ncbi:hypothetical protein ACPPVU_13690 [Mucilaginibacter sp. McL0603]|uniref:hypothetical protein n=1 Tax=Mucilaginibacter sp. McL0603 TaxID=3415670 RepID=UPI003CEED0C9